MLKEKASHKIVMTRLRYALTGKYQSYNKYYYYAPFFSVHNMDTSFLFCKVNKNLRLGVGFKGNIPYGFYV